MNKTIEFLLGWLLKPSYKVTTLDEIIGTIEFIILLIIVSYIVVSIQERKNKR